MRGTAGKTWAGRVRRWRASGLGAREFARREGLRESTLRWWAWRLSKGGGRATFVEVAVPVVASAPVIEVVVRGGARISVSAGFDAALLRQVVAALEAD